MGRWGWGGDKGVGVLGYGGVGWDKGVGVLIGVWRGGVILSILGYLGEPSPVVRPTLNAHCHI